MTEATATDIPKGFWQNASGDLVRVEKIKQIDKDRDALVRTIADQAKQMAEALLKFKKAALASIEAFQLRSAADYGAKLRKKTKGNLSLTCFDGKFKVILAVQDTLTFDERLQTAKALIDECVHSWAKGANKNIQALVNHAFQVDKAGKVSTRRVLDLRKLEIDDATWKRAMDAIADSMSAASSKTYLRVYERNDAGEYLPIALDVSAK